jgi:DNA repair ATPase RecN
MNKLKDLFTESHIQVPEDKVDLVDELADNVEELEAKLNESTERSIQMAEELETYKRESIIREATKDLAETQVEKLKSLAENVDFDDEETFAKKVAQLKESYFAKTAKTQEEIIEDDDAPVVESTGSMDSYLKAIKKTASK